MNLWERFRTVFRKPRNKPEHLLHGELGENAAKRHLRKAGLKFLTANFRTERGEIDLVFRDRPRRGLAHLFDSRWDCLVFVEVKTRSSEDWTRPAAAVNREKRLHLTRAALDYLRRIKNPSIRIRFDIVEVLLEDGKVHEVRHLPNSFPMEKPYRYDG
jgi:putative endonuclease